MRLAGATAALALCLAALPFAAVADGQRLSATIAITGQIVPTAGIPATGDEFVGPFASWYNPKLLAGQTDPKGLRGCPSNAAQAAVGDGSTDDTAAIQRCLNDLGRGNNSPVLWMPAGSYKITSTLVTGATSVGGPPINNTAIIGEDPGTNSSPITSILWYGPSGGTMLHVNGNSSSKFSRLTLDGRGSAGSIVDQSANLYYCSTTLCFDTSNEFSDLIIKNGSFGYNCGQNSIFTGGCAESTVDRDQFYNMTSACIFAGNQNALDVWIAYSIFDHCYRGVTTYVPGSSSGASMRIHNNIFRSSGYADINFNFAAPSAVRNNYSINSHKFIEAGGYGSPQILTVQGNTVLDTTDTTNCYAITVPNEGPLLLYDNQFRVSCVGQWGTVFMGAFDGTGDAVAINNKYSRGAGGCGYALCVNNRQMNIGEQLNQTVTASEPTLPGVEPNNHRAVFEPAGFTSAAINAAITAAQAQSGNRPVVHLPYGHYRVTSTITIPAGSDAQLVGDGLATVLDLSNFSGCAIQANGPTLATFRDFKISGTASGGVVTENAVCANNIDQVGSRVYIHRAWSNSSSQSNLFADRLTNTAVEVDNFYQGEQSSTGTTGAASIKVVGGSSPAGGKVNIYSGLGANALEFAVSNGGQLLVRDLWMDHSVSPAFMTSSGPVTASFENLSISSPTSSGCPSPLGNNFAISNLGANGRVSMLGVFGIGDISVSGTGGNPSSVLAAGYVAGYPQSCVGGAPYYHNTASNSVFELVGSKQEQSASIGATNQTPSTPLAVDATYVANLFAQTRAATQQPPTALPAGISDLRMYGIWIEAAANNIHLEGASTDITPPSVPMGLAGTAVASTQVNLSWTASTDNVGVAGYYIYRNGNQVGLSTTSSFSDIGLAANRPYSYTVAAYDAAGNTSAQSAAVSVTTAGTTSTGYVAWWKFDEGSGTTASDSSGNGNTGTLSAGVGWLNPGVVGPSAVSFNGTSGSVGVPDSSSLNQTGDLTIAFWVELNGANPGTTLLSKQGDYSDGINNSTPWDLDIASSGNLVYWHHTSGGSWKSFITFGGYTLPTNNTWVHIALTRASASRTVTLYVDGAARSSLTYDAGDLPGANTTAASLGAEYRTQSFFNGRMDDVRVYTHVLTAAEIQTLYSAAVPTATLAANPVTITSGQSSTLAWSSTNATACPGTGFSTGNAVSGSVTVTPPTTTTYSVACTGSTGLTFRIDQPVEFVPVGTNFVTNGTFESPGSLAAPWTDFGSGATVVAANARSATHSGLATNAGGFQGLFQDIQGLTPNTSYDLKGWASKTTAGTPGNSCFIGAKNFSSGPAVNAEITGGGTYAQYAPPTFTTDGVHSAAQIYVFCDTGVANFDDITVTLH